jgi:hypothetical protein
MADISIGLDMGPGVPPALLGRTLCDVGAVADAALVIGTMEARSAAQAAILNLAFSEPGALSERLRASEDDSRELRLWLDQIRVQRRLTEEWEEWAPYFARGRARYPPALPFLWFSAPGEQLEMPHSVRRLIAADALERRGNEAVLRRVQYENPVEVVLEATAAVFVAAGWLLTIVRDWRAQQRIGEAVADDIVNSVRAREIFRQELLRKVAEGQIQASPEEIMAALGDAPINGMARLAALRPNVEIGHSE